MGYSPAPHAVVLVMRRSSVPSHRVPRDVVVGSPVLERALRFGRRLSFTWRLPALLPEQPVSLELTPETPRSVEVAGGHVVVLVVG